MNVRMYSESCLMELSARIIQQHTGIRWAGLIAKRIRDINNYTSGPTRQCTVFTSKIQSTLAKSKSHKSKKSQKSKDFISSLPLFSIVLYPYKSKFF